jgi:hypothetical protein
MVQRPQADYSDERSLGSKPWTGLAPPLITILLGHNENDCSWPDRLLLAWSVEHTSSLPTLPDRAHGLIRCTRQRSLLVVYQVRF